MAIQNVTYMWTDSDVDGTRAWFDVDGEPYAITDDGSLLDADGYPIEPSDRDSIYIKQAIEKIGNSQMKNQHHNDGTVTYWSVYRQVWVNRATTIPDRELAAMPSSERIRAIRNLQKLN